MEKKNALLVKNFAKDINLLKAIVPNAIQTKQFGRKRALIYLANRQDANAAFAQLLAAFKSTKTHVQFMQQDAVQTKSKKVDKIEKVSRKTQTDWDWKDVGSLPEAYIRQIYGIDNDILFDRPPPCHYCYDYPKATMDIVDAISIELMKNAEFYVKVLDVMNRMNLDPPFPAKEVYYRRGVPKEAATQTGEKSVSSESELSDDEIQIPLAPPVKRKKVCTEEQLQKKARLLLQGALHTTQLTKQMQKEKKQKVCKKVFDKVPPKCTTIEMKVPLKPKYMEKLEKLEKIATEKIQTTFVLPADLSTLKMSEEERQTLPIFQSYVQGDQSDKLYIKNLAKNVTAEDIVALYERFVVDAEQDLHVRVMQQGRMKGQAFVTFQSKTVDNKVTASLALEATNGLKLYDKPLVVCFGKKRDT